MALNRFTAARWSSSAIGAGAGEQGGDGGVVVDARRAGVPRLAGAVAAVGERGPLPEVEDGGGARRVVGLRVDHRHDLAAEQEEVGDRPQVAGVDLAARAAGPATDLLRRHRGVDALHHLRVAQEGLGAGHHDVGGDRDQRALERGALLRERLGDRRVVGDQPVGGLDRRSRRQPRTIASSPGAVELDLGAGGRLVAAEARSPSRTGTWNSRLTIPMWLRSVPLVQMIAVSSW